MVTMLPRHPTATLRIEFRNRSLVDRYEYRIELQWDTPRVHRISIHRHISLFIYRYEYRNEFDYRSIRYPKQIVVSLRGVGDGVVGHHVAVGPHGHADAVLVVLEMVARDARVRRLQHGHAGVTVAEAVVVCEHTSETSRVHDTPVRSCGISSWGGRRNINELPYASSPSILSANAPAASRREEDSTILVYWYFVYLYMTSYTTVYKLSLIHI